MKVKCVKTYGELSLTVGKIYDILDEGTIGSIPVYKVKLDSGFSHFVMKSHFLTIEQLRNDKLNELGI
jgi:hypothetical protein